MKLRGTVGGLNLLIERTDTPSSVRAGLEPRRELLSERVTIELAGDTDMGTLDAALACIREAGGAVERVRAERAPNSQAEGGGARTEIVPHSLRAGFRGEYRGSVVILGDVNPGAEVVAGGDVIVMGALRGVVHAGAGGHPEAIVWAKPIASPQIRLADALARAPEGNSLSSMRKVEGQAEIARLHDGAIVIEAHGPVRPG